VFYFIVLGITYILYPLPKKNSQYDTINSNKTIWGIDRREVIFNPPDLHSDSRKQLIFFGSSNIKEGFRAKELRKFLPDYTIQNISFGGCSIEEMKELAEYLVNNAKGKSLDNSLFVLGLYYGVFSTKEQQENTVFTDEKLRYGLYKSNNGNIEPAFSESVSPLIKTLLRPFLLLSNPVRLWNIGMHNVRLVYESLIRDHRLDITPIQQLFSPESVAIFTKREDTVARYQEMYLQKQKSRIPESQFEALLDTYRILNRAGARVIVLESPLPSWHRDASNQFHAYQRQKVPYFTQLKNSGVSILDFTELIPDSLFLDATHPLPSSSSNWSELLAHNIN